MVIVSIFLPFVTKVDFWRGPARPSLPVDMRVPFSALKDIKAFLESHGLAYSIMIKDIQVRSCPSATVRDPPSTCLAGLGLTWRKTNQSQQASCFWGSICILVNQLWKE